jgi:hypothetical protein
MTRHLQAQIILHVILRLGYISIIGYNVIYDLWLHLSDVPQWQFQIQNMTRANTWTSRVICLGATVQNYLNFAIAAIAEATGTIRAVSWTMWLKKEKKDYT